jgi:hypothetical protein
MSNPGSFPKHPPNVTPIEAAKKRQARRPWHLCSTCYHFFVNEGAPNLGWCNHDPVTTETYPERQGCAYWECVGCGGTYDDGDDHLACLEGIGVVEIKEC